MKQRFTIAFFLVAAVAMMGAGCTNTATTNTNATGNTNEAAEASVMVELKTSGAEEVYNQQLKVEDGATVLEVMEAAEAEGTFEFTTQTAEGLGEYVDSVGGVEGSADAGYWLFYVNDEASVEGVTAVEVEDGDVIEWKLEPAF